LVTAVRYLAASAAQFEKSNWCAQACRASAATYSIPSAMIATTIRPTRKGCS
jgi:hypothetical protein